MDNAKILIVYTGGTIGMVETPQGLQPFDFSHLMDNVPKLSELGYTVQDSYRFIEYESRILEYDCQGYCRQL